MAACAHAPVAPAEAFRAAAPGKFVTSTHGRTHYHIASPETPAEGLPLLVCVHGISAECAIWEHFVRYYTARGRTVLTYDLFGRGFSDAASRPNDLTLFVGQLQELLDAPDVHGAISTATIDLIGVSLGGAIAAGFAAQYPTRVRKLVLVAPAGLGLPTGGGVGQALCKYPGLGKLAVKISLMGGVENGMKNSFGNPTDPEVVAYLPGAAARAKAIDENSPGYLPSLVSTLGHFPLDSMQEQYITLGATRQSFLVVWGDKDKVVDFFRDSPRLLSLAPCARIQVLRGSGHIDHFVITRFRDQFHAVTEKYLNGPDPNM